MKIKFLTTILIIFFISSVKAHDLPIFINKDISGEYHFLLNSVFEVASNLMPIKLKKGLPNHIEIKLDNLSHLSNIPRDICDNKSFVYGSYSKVNNTLTIEKLLIDEIKKGRSNSTIIKCQHKNIYDQIIATIIHELSHAYDFNNNNISESNVFVAVSDFKKSIFGIRNKNKNPIRSEDTYEIKNINEYFAVNMEYFLMDSEFACRKPSLFNFYKSLFEIDPFPNRNCKVNTIVMMTSANGLIPVEIDPNRVYRVDYLMASPGKDISSGFGHSMFRIIMCAPDHIDPITKLEIKATTFGPKCLEDKLYHLILSYRANVEDVTLSYVKGLMGGYPSMLFILNFSDVLDEYNKDELRDIYSYPLKLSEKEKKDFIIRSIEEHWNYRGSYKFVTNNCAVEAFDLVNRVLDLNKKSSITPNGVLNELSNLKLIDLKDSKIEKYNTKLDSLLNSYKLAYDQQTSMNRKLLQKFIDNSDSEFRKNSFEQFKASKISEGNLHTVVSEFRDRVIRSSSFSVLEQQILRSKISDLKKKIAKLILNSKDEKIRNYFDQKTAEVKNRQNLSFLDGYGIPLANELDNLNTDEAKNENNSTSKVELESMIRSLAPNDYLEIESISKNNQSFGEYTLLMRKEFKVKLDSYIGEVLNNLARNSEMRQILLAAIQNDHDSLIKIRQLLGTDLVSEQEIVDSKLIKLMETIVSSN